MLRAFGLFLSAYLMIARDATVIAAARRSTYSFLFYGYSLSDRDLLQSMDDMMESFGSEIGPHFWLTAQEVRGPVLCSSGGGGRRVLTCLRVCVCMGGTGGG